MRKPIVDDPDITPLSVEPCPQDLLTTAEVAQMVRRTPRTIRNWVAQGLLTPLSLPGPRLFRRGGVEQLLGCPDFNQTSEQSQLCSSSP